MPPSTRSRWNGAAHLSDDAVLREAGRFHLGVESVNTQHVLTFLERRGLLAQEACYEYLEKMAQHNFKHVLLSAHFFLWLVEKHGNKADDSVRSAFLYLEAPMCNDEGALKIVATLICVPDGDCRLSPARFSDLFRPLPLALS